MSQRDKTRPEAAFSLVEVVLALAVGGILFVVGASLLQYLHTTQHRAQSRLDGEQMGELLAARIKKDFARVSMAARPTQTCAGPTCVMVQANGDRVTYATTCQPVPRIYLLDNTAPGLCVGCAGVTMPVVSVTLVPASGPTRTTVFGKRVGEDSVVGVAACFNLDVANNQLRLDLDVIAALTSTTASHYRNQSAFAIANTSGLDVRER